MAAKDQPFLTSLGVPPNRQARPPNSESFPLSFNPNNFHVWEEILRDFIPTGNVVNDWGKVIRLYIDTCYDRSIYPFQNLHQSKNDQIYHYLKDRRREVVRFINKSKLFHEIAIRDSRRKVAMTDSGFTLEVFAICRLKDPLFIKWLQKSPYPKFDIVRQPNGRYMKPLMDGLSMFVYNDGAQLSQRWHIGYVIECPMYPEIPGEPVPSKGELERFILKVFWEPILRSMRPDGVLHRLV
jgi:hypothetical protein